MGDLAGHRFGHLLAVEEGQLQGQNRAWVCRCDCGREVLVRRDKLMDGRRRSCGCMLLANNASAKVEGARKAARRQGDRNRKRALVKCAHSSCDRRVATHSHTGLCREHVRPLLSLIKRRKRGTGGRRIDAQGYVYVMAKGHPNSHSNGQIAEHRLVMSTKLGRPLKKTENVHHKDGNRRNNAPENLELWIRPQPAGQRASDLYEEDAHDW